MAQVLERDIEKELEDELKGLPKGKSSKKKTSKPNPSSDGSVLSKPKTTTKTKKAAPSKSSKKKENISVSPDMLSLQENNETTNNIIEIPKTLDEDFNEKENEVKSLEINAPLSSVEVSEMDKKDTNKKTKESKGKDNISSVDDFLLGDTKKSANKVTKKEPKNEKNVVTPKKESDVKKSKKKKWVIIIVIVIVLLSLGFGLGFGLTGKDKNSTSVPGNAGAQVDDDMYQVEVLEQHAANWTYEQLYSTYGLIDEAEYNRTTEDADKDADNQINSEKESYKDQYGDSWEDEWNNYLLDQGYDNQEQYKDALISQSLKAECDSIISDYFVRFIPQQEILDSGVDYRYHSTVPDADGVGSAEEGYWVVDNGEYALDGAGQEGAHSINSEILYQGYVNLENPISYYDLLMPFTLNGNSSYSGLYGTRIDFNDTTEGPVNLETSWEIASDYYMSWFNTMSGAGDSIEKSFSSYDSTITTQASLNDVSENQFISNALIEMFIPEVNTSFSLTGGNGVTFDGAANSFYNVNDTIGNALLLDIYTDGLASVTEVWPGYTYNEGSANTIPTDPTTKAASISQVKSGPEGGTQQSYFDGILSSQEEIIGLNLLNSVENTSLFANPSGGAARSLYLQVPLNYNSYYYDWNTDTDYLEMHSDYYDWNTDTDYLEVHSDNFDQSEELIESAYLVLDSTGLHLLSPTIYNDDTMDTGGYSYGELMLIGDLDRRALDGTSQPKPPSSMVKSNFDIWFTSASNYLYLNEALNDYDFVNTYVQDMDGDGEIEAVDEANGTIGGEDYDIVIENFYNDIYNTQYSKFLAKTSAFGDFYDQYRGLYNFKGYDIGTNLQVIENYLVFFQKTSDYNWTPTGDILLNGNLAGSEGEM